MRPLATILLCCALAGTAAAAPPKPVSTPALVRVASKLSGLPVKRPIPIVALSAAELRRRARALAAREYGAKQQAHDESVYRALGLLAAGERLGPFLAARSDASAAVYDPVGRRIYVRRGAGRLPVLRELVRALHDQAFELRRMSRARLGRDGAAAAKAAVEGNVVLSTELLGGVRAAGAAGTHGSQPARPIGTFLELVHAFPSATGVQFVAALHNLGGRTVARTAVRRPPETTAQVFHLDAYLERRGAPLPGVATNAAGFALVSHDTFGELDVRALLAVFQVPRLDRVGRGWSSGRAATYRDGAGREAVVVALDWTTEVDGAEWAEAAATYVNEAFDPETPGAPPATPCAATSCWAFDDRVVAFGRAGRRSLLAVAPSLAVAEALASL